MFFFFFLILFSKISFSLQKEEAFWKTSKKQQKNTHFYKLKTGPIMLRNMLGPVFNLYLDQFLTYKICYFFCFFFFFAETPIL